VAVAAVGEAALRAAATCVLTASPLNAHLPTPAPSLAAAPLPLPASDNHVGDEGASALAKCLGHNTTLTYLNL
jgi:hypothetical protein